MPKLDRIDPATLAVNPRASQASWRKFESIVEQAYNRHPLPYRFTPQGYAATTVVSRLRDAIRGCLAFEYPTFATPAALTKWWSETVIRQHGAEVLIGPAEAVAETLQKPLTAVAPAPSSSMSFDTLTFEEVAAFMCLIAGQRINGPVKVHAPPDLSLLAQRPNVDLITRPDGTLIIT